MKNFYQTILAFCALLISFNSRAQVPLYNSYPSATATVYLDFDGQYVNGTAWNGNGPITCDPANVTNDQVTEIFNRVAEDFRPFNVNITTDSTKYWAAPVYQRMRVILTVTSGWYGAAGGVSFINSFSWGDNTPCFVFTALLNYSSKKLAEAASHEIGHTLGLSHQSAYDNNCVKTSEYNAGTGTGEIAWAPIMGNGYGKNMTLWHNGSNPWGCTDFQNDLAIITSGMNGFTYRADDHSNNANATATLASLSNNQFNVSGIIEQESDSDVFRFTLPAIGNFHLDAMPYNIGVNNNAADLDVQVELISSDQTVLGTYNPDLLLNSVIDTFLQAGTYYLRIEGKGNMYAPEYASLGSYNLNATFTPSVVLPVHRLELRGAVENKKHNLNWDIEADEAVAEQSLEVSTNGINFQTVSVLNNASRNYLYTPGNGIIYYYRLHVQFDNHASYYSNTLTLPNTMNPRPTITNNSVRVAVSVNSPAPFAYTIVDYSGRTVLKGKLLQGMNQINTMSLSNGMYLIQFSNGQEQYVEKFMKE